MAARAVKFFLILGVKHLNKRIDIYTKQVYTIIVPREQKERKKK
jgi:hypothetical protein